MLKSRAYSQHGYITTDPVVCIYKLLCNTQWAFCWILHLVLALISGLVRLYERAKLGRRGEKVHWLAQSEYFPWAFTAVKQRRLVLLCKNTITQFAVLPSISSYFLHFLSFSTMNVSTHSEINIHSISLLNRQKLGDLTAAHFDCVQASSLQQMCDREKKKKGGQRICAHTLTGRVSGFFPDSFLYLM